MAKKESKGISEQELKSILNTEIASAKGYRDDLSSFRQKALDYYFGRPFGTERPGFSKVVSRDVQDVVESAIPKILEAFVGSGDVVEWLPKGSIDEDESERNAAKAKEQTAYANYVFNVKNDGFSVLQAAFKDALLFKNGTVKTTFGRPVGLERTIEKEGLTEEEFLLLKEEVEDSPDMEITAIKKETKTEIEELPLTDPQTGQPVIDPKTQQPVIQGLEVKTTTISVRVVVQAKEQCLIESIPPEEFLIDRDAKGVNTARFTGHDTMKTASDLIAEGFDRDIVEGLPFDTDDDKQTEKDARTDVNFETDQTPAGNKSMKKINVIECYYRIDMDDDGVAEFRKITVAGSDGSFTILDNEPIDFNPFSGYVPIVMTHRYEGISLSELVFDVQENKSTMIRQLIDNTYLNNVPMKTVLEGKVNLDDLLSPRVGGIIRVKDQDAIRDMVVPNTAKNSLEVIQAFDQIKDARTGVNDVSKGMNSDFLQNATATAINRIEAAADARMNLMTRNFANTLKDMFRKVLHCSQKFSNEAEIISLTGNFVEVDPRKFDLTLDMSVNVGLGNAHKQTKLATLSMIKQDQLQLGSVGSVLVDDQQLFNTYKEITDVVGMANTETFFKDPSKEKEPQPTPEEIKQQVLQSTEVQMRTRALDLKEREVAVKEQSESFDAQFKAQKQKTDEAVKGLELQLEKQKLEIEELKVGVSGKLKNKELNTQTALEIEKLAQGKGDGNIPGDIADLI